jgi:hypothetical protein
VRTHQHVDAVDLDQPDAREDPPQQTPVDGTTRRRVGESLSRKRDSPRLRERKVGDPAGIIRGRRPLPRSLQQNERPSFRLVLRRDQ